MKSKQMYNHYPNPEETYDEVKEYTKEELFYQEESHSDETINYVDELEKIIKEFRSKNKAAVSDLITLRETAQAGGRLTFYVKKMNGLINKLK